MDFLKIVGFFFLEVWLAPIIVIGSTILAEVTIPVHFTELAPNRENIIDSIRQNVISLLQSTFQVVYNKKD